ncbi:MAG: DUF309 domain-containing protein [Planctomycetaceae bacterium]
MSLDPEDPRIDDGIRLFNQREFFASHDVFEDLWMELVGREKTFVQGLIHGAVCLHHFEGSNLTGARKMYGSCTCYLRPFQPRFAGIDVQRLLDDMELCFAELLAVERGYPHGVVLKPELIPRIVRRR